MPKLALYHYHGCFFCGMVRQVLGNYDFDVELRDTHENRDWQNELLEARGRRTVPVMRIESEDGSVEWMGESRDIVAYLATLAG